MPDPQSNRRAVYEGELRATLCKACHGADGNSVREGTPSLAGQDPVYLVDQFAAKTTQYDIDGRVLQVFENTAELPQPVAVAVDDKLVS